MDKDQITALAREYGVDSVDPYGFSKDTYEDFVDEYADAAADVLRWLSKRFYLVEKKAIEAKYQEAKERHFNPDDEIEKTMYGGRMSLLEYLSPEIAKEVEG